MTMNFPRGCSREMPMRHVPQVPTNSVLLHRRRIEGSFLFFRMTEAFVTFSERGWGIFDRACLNGIVP
jgi:hypothetical protein